MKKKPEIVEVDLLSYEEAYSELIELVNSLESEEHTLDESIKLFERGQELTRHCSELLDKAELKILQLKGDQIVTLEE